MRFFLIPGGRPSNRTTFAVLFALVVNIAINAPSRAQQQSNVPAVLPARDAAALAVLRNVVRVLGGETTGSSIKDTITTAECTRQRNGASEAHHLRWITAGSYFRVDAGEGDHAGIVNGPKGRTAMLKGKETPLSERSGRAFRSLHVPLLPILEILAKDKMQIELLADATINSSPVYHVRITDIVASETAPESVKEDWYFDKANYFPVRLTYAVPGVGGMRTSVDSTIDYQGFAVDRASGMAIPASFQRTYEGSSPTTCTIQTFAVNQKPSEFQFVRSSGGAQ